MDNNRGQTIFLSVIGIATLLVAIIGATFAYFTTQVTGKGEGGNVDGTTAKISGTTLTFDKDTTQTYDYLQYPGGLAVFGTKAQLKKDDTSDTNDYVATFNLKIEYDNPTNTKLHYTLYMLENSPTDVTLDPKCKLMTKTAGKQTYLWYGDDAEEDDGTDESSECLFDSTALSVFSKLNTIASGELKTKTTGGTIDKDTIQGNPFAGRTLDTQVGGTSTKYYYLVIDYPNDGDQTEGDATGEQIRVSLTLDKDNIKVDKGTVTP